MNSERIRSLRHEGKNEEARLLAAELAASAEADALVLYEAACVHDYLGHEAQAVSFYVRAMAAGLPDEQLRSACLGLGSTYRALGRYEESLALLAEGLARFPQAREFAVFRAMALYNLGRSKEAVASLLHVVAETTNDGEVQKLRGAIHLYAEDLDRTWK